MQSTFENINKLNFNLKNFSERLQFLNEKYVRNKDFYEEYKEKTYLSLENDCNYLLNSLDLEKARKYKYKILNKKEFDDLLKSEKKDNIDELAVLKTDNKNIYLSCDIRITNSDFKDDELKDVLIEYNKLKNKCKNILLGIKKGEKSSFTLNFIKRALASVNDDMILSKKSIKRFRRLSTKLGDIGTVPSYELIDYNNAEHIKNIIKYCKFGSLAPNNELSHIAFDVENIVKVMFKEKLINKTELNIINAINEGMSYVAIAREHNISETAIRKKFKIICRKISLRISD